MATLAKIAEIEAEVRSFKKNRNPKTLYFRLFSWVLFYFILFQFFIMFIDRNLRETSLRHDEQRLDHRMDESFCCCL